MGLDILFLMIHYICLFCLLFVDGHIVHAREYMPLLFCNYAYVRALGGIEILISILLLYMQVYKASILLCVEKEGHA